ncbi:MAG: magnesium transporter CorA family protein [Acidimicrobiaceae bacterium]|nr:magnesium transporter CorA family protein [Acidimicrobiaceae bacterium]
MLIRAVEFGTSECAVEIEPSAALPPEGWVWIDITVDAGDADELVSFAEQLGLDALAVRDTVEDFDLPKVDDFGNSLLVVLHALREDRIETYELDCFLSKRRLVTVHQGRSLSVDALWNGVRTRPALASGDADDTLARLADVATRRLINVLDVFDDRNDELNELALRADSAFLGEITAVRADLAVLRRAVHPQREVLDILRHSTSSLISESGRRRFSDVFDAAQRAAAGVESGRAALAETLDAYRGAEARQATEVTKVLTVYAAIMLPLTLVVGYFGMNFVNLPLIHRPSGWIVVTVFMAVIALVSLGVFVTLGWIRRPSAEPVVTQGRQPIRRSYKFAAALDCSGKAGQRRRARGCPALDAQRRRRRAASATRGSPRSADHARTTVAGH